MKNELKFMQRNKYTDMGQELNSPKNFHSDRQTQIPSN
jgi:hypothetical protein